MWWELQPANHLGTPLGQLNKVMTQKLKAIIIGSVLAVLVVLFAITSKSAGTDTMTVTGVCGFVGDGYIVLTNNTLLLVVTNGSNIASASLNVPTSTTIQTNWISGKYYTNFTAREWQVSEIVTNVLAAVAGSSGTELWVGYSTNSAPVSPSTCLITTVLGGLATTTPYTLSGSVPIGGYCCFTNLSSGLGNSSTYRPSSGQWTIR